MQAIFEHTSVLQKYLNIEDKAKIQLFHPTRYTAVSLAAGSEQIILRALHHSNG